MRLERWLYTVPLRFRSLFRRNQVEGELDEEFRYHIDRLTDEHIARGLSPADARRAALRAMHGVEQRKEECRDTRRVRIVEDALQDLRYAGRMLMRSPGFAVAAIVTLTLGIGATVAVFSVVNGVLLRPLAFPQPERLFLLIHSPRGPMIRQPSMSDRDYLAFREADRSFEHVAAFSSYNGNLVGAGDPAVISVGRVTREFFDVFGVPPALGRASLRDEEEKQPDRQIVLSHELWRSRFGADAAVVGKSITLDGESRTVIGVMPAGFTFPAEAVAWTFYEITLDPHNGFATPVVGRLKPGVTRAQAQAQFETIARHFSNWSSEPVVSGLLPLKELLVGDVRRPLQVFAAAVVFVLLIACANVANLLLARATRREREIAIRAAIGASRGRLLRQLLTESAWLSFAGGAIGIILAGWMVSALLSLAPPGRIPRLEHVRIDSWVVAFAVGVSLITAVLFGIAPALRITRRGSRESLAPSLRPSVRGQERLRTFLVVAEIALALVLLTGAGLMLQSFVRLRAIDPGFHPRNVMTLTVDLPQSTYPTVEKMHAFHSAFLERLAALPGVIDASAVNWRPLGTMLIQGDFHAEGSTAASANLIADKVAVSPGYFSTMGIRLVRGRDFTARDNTSSVGVAILSHTVARLLESSGDAIGRRITLEDNPKPEDWLTVIGVVDDVRQWGPAQAPHAAIYQPYLQVHRPFFLSHMTFAARTDGDPLTLAPAMRSALRAVDMNQPAASVVLMENVLGAATAEPRFQARLLGMFALLAFILALVGTYGVLAYSVAQGTREIGVRMALGARSRTLVWMVLRRTLTLSAIGIALGMAGALATTRLLRSLLFEITPTDPATFTTVSIAILVAALAAGFIPAQRAARVDPLVALRHE
jgi:predicted permease